MNRVYKDHRIENNQCILQIKTVKFVFPNQLNNELKQRSC